MGHPKFARPKTQTPTHPWKAARIEEEHALKDQFGLKKVGGMREIWREKSALRRHRNQAMKLIGRVDSSEGHYAQENRLGRFSCSQGTTSRGVQCGRCSTDYRRAYACSKATISGLLPWSCALNAGSSKHDCPWTHLDW